MTLDFAQVHRLGGNCADNSVYGSTTVTLEVR